MLEVSWWRLTSATAVHPARAAPEPLVVAAEAGTGTVYPTGRRGGMERASKKAGEQGSGRDGGPSERGSDDRRAVKSEVTSRK